MGVLNAKSLMIGDWVKLGKRILRCKNILGHTNDVVFENGVITNIMNIEPIPLTPEILEKNGFVKQNFDGWEYIHPDDSTFSYIDYRILWRTDYDNHLFIKKYKESGTSATLQISDINYVHQLQQALKLCGINKEIIL